MPNKIELVKFSNHEKFDTNTANLFLDLVDNNGKMDNISTLDLGSENQFYINNRKFRVSTDSSNIECLKCTLISIVEMDLQMKDNSLVQKLNMYDQCNVNRWIRIGQFDIFETETYLGLRKGYFRNQLNEYGKGEFLDIGGYKLVLIENILNYGWYEYKFEI